MKKLQILILICTIQNAHSQLPFNGGFELWTTDTSGYSSPVGWVTNNGIADTATVLPASGHSGNSSIHFVSVSDGATGFWGGEADYTIDGNIKPLLLTGFWKGNFQIGGDRLAITFTVLDSNYQIITQAVFNTPILANTSQWTPLTCSISYPSAVEPYHTFIVADIGTIGQSTEGYLDDLELTYITSTNNIITSPLFSANIKSHLNTNPKLIFESHVSESIIISVCNLNGQILYTKKYAIVSGKNEFPLPEQTEGVYLCNIQVNDFRKCIKYFVQ